jgi:hypothetical protein
LLRDRRAPLLGGVREDDLMRITAGRRSEKIPASLSRFSKPSIFHGGASARQDVITPTSLGWPHLNAAQRAACDVAHLDLRVASLIGAALNIERQQFGKLARVLRARQLAAGEIMLNVFRRYNIEKVELHDASFNRSKMMGSERLTSCVAGPFLLIRFAVTQSQRNAVNNLRTGLR